MEKWNDLFGIWTWGLQHQSHHKSLGKLAKKIMEVIIQWQKVAKSGKKLLIFKAGNSNQDKFKTLKAPRMHIFQAASKKTFEFTS